MITKNEQNWDRIKIRARWITAGILYPIAWISITTTFKDVFPLFFNSPYFIFPSLGIAIILFWKAGTSIIG